MAKEKKLVEAITAMDEDFAQWYTDVVKKAELIEYSSVKGCMILRPNGYAIWENIQKVMMLNLKRQVWKMWQCRCLFRKAFWRERKTTWKALRRKLRG